MKKPTEVDVQASVILQGLRHLEELLKKPIARDALDLGKNAENAENDRILRRLTHSLTQYLEREGDLYYVGLLGHFSTGKSSTINSLLGIWESQHQRETGLNPTDTTITLITQQKNVNSLLGVIHEGHVTIRFQAVDAPLLDNVVLVDSPGTGDPNLIEEIARDFLPICDVILFLFSAASPLDQTDMPLLTELHKRLPFIPIQFVITRADELATDTARPVSDDNIDPRQKALFLAEVLVRINKLLSPRTYTEEHLVLIDNKAGYNIDMVREYISANSNPTDPHARISMHGHKLHFFRSNAQAMRDYFSGFLEKKLTELNKIVGAAENNVLKYNELVRISNDNLTRAWIDHLAAINTARDETVRYVQIAPEIAPTVEYLPVVIKSREESRAALAEMALSTSKLVCSRLRSEMIDILIRKLRTVRDDLMKLDLSTIDSNSHRLEPIGVKLELDGVELVPRLRMQRVWLQDRTSRCDALVMGADDLRQRVSKTERLLQQRSPLTESENEVGAAQETLRVDLTRFYDNVELYRDGVFSHRTKESISTLGIGRDLDELESSFDDADKTGYTSQAIDEMFPAHNAQIVDGRKRLEVFDKKLAQIRVDLRSLELIAPVLDKVAIESTSEEQEGLFLASLANAAQIDMDKIVNKTRSALSGVLADFRSSYDRAIKNAKNTQTRRYWRLGIGGGIATLAAYFGYRYFLQPVSQTIIATIGYGVLSALLGDAVGLGVATIRDSFPEDIAKIKADSRSNLQNAVNKIVDSDADQHEIPAADEAALTYRLNQIYLEVLRNGAANWNIQASEFLAALRTLARDYGEVRNQYVSAVDDIAGQCATYFNDSSRNLTILNEVARRIKESAIEPSFNLLDNTRGQLEEVKEEINKVRFA